MPKVSQAHRDARRRQILDAARRCFIRDGFHAASMQEILAEAGLSAGAVYRYFESKEEIVIAIAGEAIGEIAETLAGAARADPPLPLDEALGAAVAAIERLDAEYGATRLALQVWAEASFSPPLAARLGEALGDARSRLALLVAAEQERGGIDPGADPDEVARVLLGVLPGFIVQRAVLEDVDAAGFRAGLRAVLVAQRDARTDF